MKFFKSAIVWILALQILNMSIYSESYWYYFNDNAALTGQNTSEDINAADPTETIIEWIVEWKSGQNSAFTYKNNTIGSIMTAKATAFSFAVYFSDIDLKIVRSKIRLLYPQFISKLETRDAEIICPPPEIAFFS